MSSRLRALTEFSEAEGRDDTHHAFNRANAYMYHNPTIGSVACRRAASAHGWHELYKIKKSS